LLADPSLGQFKTVAKEKAGEYNAGNDINVKIEGVTLSFA